MALAATIDLLRAAEAEGYAVAAFNVIGIEHAEAIVAGAERERSPVILQLSQNAVRYHLDAVEPIGAACREIAARAAVPVALHLDHATEIELCRRAVAVGFGSLMYDAATGSAGGDIRRFREVVAWAHAWGVSVEGALGTVGGKDGARTSAAGMTNPDAAADYVARTGVDALAIAVGTTHGMVEQTARIDLGLVGRLRERVAVPLVLHGSSGVPDADLAAAARLGVAKINLATQLNKVFTAAVRGALAADPELVDPRPYLARARDAVAETVRDRLRLLGSASRA